MLGEQLGSYGDFNLSFGSFGGGRKKSSAIVKIDMGEVKRIPILNERDMLRIYDARSEDIGQGRLIKKDCTPDKLAQMLRDFSQNTG